MKIIHKNQTKKFYNSADCIATEYPMEEKNINGAVVEIKGRYPGKGRVMNLECKEMVFVVDGEGKVVVEDNEINLNEGDLILIEPGEKYFWDGKLSLFISCTPAWHSGQHKEVD